MTGRIIVKGWDRLPRIGDPHGPIALPPYDGDIIRGRKRDYRKPDAQAPAIRRATREDNQT